MFATIAAVAAQLLGAVLSFFRALPLWVRSAFLAVVVMHFIYDGIGLPRWMPFIGGLSWTDGVVDRAIKAADARCELRVQKSIEGATKTDSAISSERIRQSEIETQEANERALVAQQAINSYEREIDALEPALRNCRRATDSDLRRLQ